MWRMGVGFVSGHGFSHAAKPGRWWALDPKLQNEEMGYGAAGAKARPFLASYGTAKAMPRYSSRPLGGRIAGDSVSPTSGDGARGVRMALHVL
jgi:hypothetical protein